VQRWILSCLDRLPSNRADDDARADAEMLGVRRVGVTQAAGKAASSGADPLRRGHIVVLDRPRLEARVCECYAVVNGSMTACSARKTSLATLVGTARIAGTIRLVKTPPTLIELTRPVLQSSCWRNEVMVRQRRNA